MNLAIIDYGAGNLASVNHVFSACGFEPTLCSNPNELKDADLIILPGVGSFRYGMNALEELGFIDALKENVLIKKKKLLGICLGMQLLAEKGLEGGESNGLGFLRGEVRSLKDLDHFSGSIPHIGWNQVSWTPEGKKISQGLNPETDYYYLHSYFFHSFDTSQVYAECDSFPVVVGKENILGIQFHPEKSQSAGLILLKKIIQYFEKI